MPSAKCRGTLKAGRTYVVVAMCLLVPGSGCMAYVLTGYHFQIIGEVRDASTGLPIEQADVLLVEGRHVDASIESASMNNAGQSRSDGKVEVGLSLKSCRHCYGPPFMWDTEPRRVLVRIVKPGYENKDLHFKGKQIIREGTDYTIDVGTVLLAQ
ncbi:MAG: hypothetical protein IT365_12835 [Candidatus Hydrogenedentes bacterium]|nr:hypothetical protein [Candidatus Hydrogenedentota bacterium]